ncbi:von Willebrand factor type A domain-containing protein [uncultured Devosia sp.]|uniref:YfbK domain-containing protein n=1 Tax=uncultured Devosia sp. TaxID=211434 RepID=UPI0035CC2070
MDMRLPIGTAAVALLLLPLGYQLYNSTAMSPADRPLLNESPTVVPEPDAEAVVPADGVARTQAPAALNDIAAPKPAVTVAAPAEAAKDEAVRAEPLGQDMIAGQAESVAPAQAPLAGTVMAPPPAAPQNFERQSNAAGAGSDGFASMLAPSPLPSATQPSGDAFTAFEESRLTVAADQPVSTFSVDVDTASYSYVRSMLDDGYVPEPDAVRLEELINYFPYDYAPADSAAVPFKPSMAVYPTPWNPRTQLLHIGIKGYVPPASADTPSNLVFLIDTSGSMDEPNKLPLLKRAFALLVDQLSAKDSIAIVAYAGSAGVVLEPTRADDKSKILAALDALAAGGSTAGAEGIALAYQLAEQARISNGTNRVILATDGDFNVGIDDPEDLENFIKAKREGGVTLSVLGFGRGNLDDATMQALAQNGNGNASYIDSFREAQKVLVEEGGSTLQMIAKDVKVQVEFNPAMVSEYRLIGYETRALNREDFNNDQVDAGDIGAGHTVTAIYEITPAGAGSVDPLRYGERGDATPTAGGEIAFLKMRYKLPDSDVSQLIEQAVTPDMVHADIGQVSDDMRFGAAVAAFGQKLKGSIYGGDMGWGDIMALAQAGRGSDEGGYRAEFMGLVKTASLLEPDAATKDDAAIQ